MSQWGPSVVEAIQKRSVTSLAKKPIVRDPHTFDREEAAMVARFPGSHLQDSKMEYPS